MPMTLALYLLAALAEIAGCFAVWSWWRGASGWWLVPGALALAGFAWALALTAPAVAGRSFAGYGGIYVVAALGWMWLVEGVRPDWGDAIGTVIILVGVAVILFAQRPG